ncbi:nucleotide-binding universal stress UspA family protein [Catalinimonas alkaloidigena]|uniref:universal stress protein n=1 Tax=Catalinimonas alkaloidigena TaxID=1075417 RepID=UPI002404A5E7|nr:universal stress protein [Catalinimonas alkaloidigena]MDF9800719.1 nucleotide-binding universal stress UspA family protein [Catalinimonas alkaloidigena]
MKSILVPTDFSQQAQFALDLAHGIAKKTSATVKLLNVVEAPHGTSFNAMGEVTAPDGMDSMFFAQLLKRMKEQLTELVKNPKYGDIKLDGEVEIGNPYESIARTISDQEVDLVVMGTQGSSGIEEVLIGSNTEKVVRRSYCPVLTVKEGVEPDSIKNIVFATNLRDDDDKLVSELTKLQKLFDATLHIVCINTPSSFETDRYYKKEMKAFVEKHKLGNYTLNVYNDDVEEDGIVFFAEDIDADMIALATHGRRGISHLLSGSIAEDVVNHAKRPVWTFSLAKK